MLAMNDVPSMVGSASSTNGAAERPSSSWRHPSLWWVGVGLITAAATLLLVAGLLAPLVTDATVAPYLSVLLPFVVVFFVFLLPYPLFLGLDARAISAGEYEWNPTPWKWAGLGLLSIGTLVLLPSGTVVLAALVGGVYLYRRHTALGIP